MECTKLDSIVIIASLFSWTLCGIFTPPNNPKITFVKNTSIGIEWDSPMQITGMTSYKVILLNVLTNATKGYTIQRNSNKALLNNLDECTAYRVYCGAEFATAESKPRVDYSLMVLSLTTGAYVQPVGDLTTEVKYGNDIAYSFKLGQSFKPACQDTLYFQVILYETSPDSNWINLLQEKTKLSAGIFKGLNFNSAFKISVTPIVQVSDTFKGETVTSGVIHTYLSMENSSPRDLAVTNIGETSAYLMWKEPLSPYGSIINYSLNILTQFGTHSVVRVTKESANGYLIDTLSPCTKYNISVQVETENLVRVMSQSSNAVSFDTLNISRLFTIASVHLNLDQIGTFMTLRVEDRRLGFPASCGRIEFKYSLWKKASNGERKLEQSLLSYHPSVNFNYIETGFVYLGSVTSRFIGAEWPRDEVFSNEVKVEKFPSPVEKIDVQYIPPNQIKFHLRINYQKGSGQMFIVELYKNNNRLLQTIFTSKLSGVFLLEEVNVPYYIAVRTKHGHSMSADIISDMIKT